MKAKMTLLFATVALAAAANAGDYGKWFDKMDANADGFLSADELGEKKAYKIQKMDSDGDGQISRDELMQYKATKSRKKDDTA